MIFNRIKKALRRQNLLPNSRPRKYLGCNLEELKEHLQRTAFENGYFDFNIDSYDSEKFHIDHVRPISSFDLTCDEELKKCHYKNLQILSAEENLEKHTDLNYIPKGRKNGRRFD